MDTFLYYVKHKSDTAGSIYKYFGLELKQLQFCNQGLPMTKNTKFQGARTLKIPSDKGMVCFSNEQNESEFANLVQERTFVLQAIGTVEQKLTSPGEFCFTVKYGPVKIPKCQAQAHASEHAEKWKAAEKKEMDKLKKFGTVVDVSVPLPGVMLRGMELRAKKKKNEIKIGKKKYWLEKYFWPLELQKN